MAVGYPGDLDVADIADVATQGGGQVALDDLAVVAVELYLQVVRADLAADGLGVVLAGEEEARHVAVVDRLYEHRQPGAGGLAGGMGEVVEVGLAVADAVGAGR
ncbi:hypothetical protein BN889_00634 [Pseudomonas aeruginosa PA38182]|nr:hypothetical protein BN889_00634 [Pseudomonas aeruginosa PA38182]